MQPTLSVVRFPWWLRLAGAAALTASGILAARVVWEQTFLTWHSGPQMVGFSLAHGGGAVLFLAPLFLLLWIAIIGVALLTGLILRRRIAVAMWFDLASALMVGAVLLVPYGMWQWLFVDRLVSGPYVGEFMTYAAATGDLRTVKALLAHGASVEVTDRSGKTGLHAAAVGNRLEVLEFLISKGARIDAINRYGDSPLEEASGSPEAARFLESRGAHRIRGTEAQRQRAVEEIVREDIEREDQRRQP